MSDAIADGRIVAAYAVGCREVITTWRDDVLSREKFLHAAEDVFDTVPEWNRHFYNDYALEGAARTPPGREKGILAGANVLMPNLSPSDVRSKYALYAHKRCMGDEAAEQLSLLDGRLQRIGYRIVFERGDYQPAVQAGAE